ncbi:hypothetical protein K1X84_15430 [bacterium]|nr:hypothetical protein [bacterium]
MKYRVLFCFFIMLSSTGFSQTDDQHYFDFWEGKWYQEINGIPDSTKTVFNVTRGVHPFSFEENWTMTFDSSRLKAKGIRVWDDSTRAWQYVWMSERGHFQIWSGKKVDGNWYIYRPFNINGDVYLSRQAWIPESRDRLMRISEKSYDHGKTWSLRFKEFYRKVNP